jgi:hypothetical protein
MGAACLPALFWVAVTSPTGEFRTTCSLAVLLATPVELSSSNMEPHRNPYLTTVRVARCACTCFAITFAATSACGAAERVEFVNDEGSESSVYVHGPSFKVALAPEELPSGTTTKSAECKTIVDAPLCALTVDIRPIERPGQVDLSEARPVDCGSYALGDAPTLFLCADASPAGSNCWHACMGWQFCHRPLYFEERCLERYGCQSCCCQPVASALHFYGSAVLLPVSMWRQCPCRCSVCTPCY